MTTQAEKDVLLGKATAVVTAALATQQAIATMAVDAVVVPPDPPPVTPPTQVTGLAVALGPVEQGVRANWMADFIDTSKLPAAVPFNCYHDRAKGIIAPPQNGVQATRYTIISPWGGRGGLRTRTPYLAPDGTIQLFAPNAEDVEYADDKLFTSGRVVSVEGKRGKCLFSPYITWEMHPTLLPDGTPIPRAPFGIGFRVDGAVFASYVTPDPAIIKLGQIKGAKGVLDGAFYPPNRKIFFVADQSRDGKGRIIRVDRTAAIAARTGEQVEDGSKWVQSDYVTNVGRITSVTCTDDGTMYACDNQNGKVLKIVHDGTTVASVTTFVVTPYAPFFVRYTSDGHIVVLDQATGFYVIDPTNPPTSILPQGSLPIVVDPNNLPASFARALIAKPELIQKSAGGINVPLTPAELPPYAVNRTLPTLRSGLIFGTISVDRNGTWGPKDQIAVSRSHGKNNADCIFYSGGGWSTCINGDGVPGGQSTRPSGDTLYQSDLFGHYPWGAWFHPDQGCLQVQGFANVMPSLVCPTRPNDPPRETWWHNIWIEGFNVFRAGTVHGHEETKPSFSCQMDTTGWGCLGVTADYIAEMSLPSGEPDFARMQAYIQGGMAGSYPRPEIAGRALFALLYFMLGSSQRLIREGQPLLDKLFAYFPPSVVNTPLPPDQQIEFRQTTELDTYIDAVATDKIKLRFRTRFNDVRVPDPNVAVRVMLDEATSAGIAVGPLWELPLPNVAAGQHSLTCRVTSATPLHYGEANLWVKA